MLRSGTFIRAFSSGQNAARKILFELTDLTLPHSWYPYARKKKRRVVVHIGPTNSGKTFSALQSLQQSSSGIYCAPLRLLAWEVAEKLNSSNVPCSLHTGQEKNEVSGAQHKSMTVEMADITQDYECAVIDEIQMIGCSKRGFSFTRALLGLAAQELHLCGDPAVVPLVQNLVMLTGDKLEIRSYNRLTPLVLLDEPIRSFKYVRGGDCLVTFSRVNVHYVKAAIENQHPAFRCSVIYGSLPAETRTKQAEQFNNSNDNYNILVASDAIGMGLNLNIQRIIFVGIDKFDGFGKRYLSTMQIKQIAGRAGRFKSKYPAGEVTSMKRIHLNMVRKALGTPTPSVEAAGIFPTLDQLDMYSKFYPSLTFSALLQKFICNALVSPLFFLCDSSTMLEVAKLLDSLPMTLEARFLFCTSPVDAHNRVIMGALHEFARNYSVSKRVPLKRLLTPGTMRVPRDQHALAELESLHKVLVLYIWLSFRFEGAFTDRAVAISQKELCSALIEEGLKTFNCGYEEQEESKFHFMTDLFKSGRLPVDDEPLDSRPLGLGVSMRKLDKWE